MDGTGPRPLLAERIRRLGPVRFGELVELALYGPGGFFTAGGGAGRAGSDFLTSPEVGPLFGRCVARALDDEWERLERPDPFLVVEAGAGRGRLAADVLRAEPRCAAALHLVLVERSAALRAEQAQRLRLEPGSAAFGPSMVAGPDEAPVPVTGSGPVVSALDALPAVRFEGVVLANELLDNLAFEIVVRTPAGWDEIRIGLEADGALTEMAVPAAPDLTRWIEQVDVPAGTRLPVATGAVEWIARASGCLRRGSVVLMDYVAPWDELAARRGGWLRTYASHARGADPLVEPGASDITIDLPLEMLRHAASRAGLAVTTQSSQAGWLRTLGIDELVAEGRSRWQRAAAAPDLAAIEGRSRAVEAAALTDPSGLGAHTVLVLRTT